MDVRGEKFLYQKKVRNMRITVRAQGTGIVHMLNTYLHLVSLANETKKRPLFIACEENNLRLGKP